MLNATVAGICFVLLSRDKIYASFFIIVILSHVSAYFWNDGWPKKLPRYIINAISVVTCGMLIFITLPLSI